MKDEEMAEQFADNISGLELTCSLLSAKDKSHAYRLGRYDGFLAGLKAGRPQWHDLEKDPADLPKDDKDMLMSGHLILLTKMKGTDYLNVALGQYNFSTQEFCYQHIVGLIDVVAWQEIVLPKESE